MKKLTLEQIAKLAGVSRATVSRVVNDHPNISDAVRQRVQRVLDETGYQPNLAARTLASNRSNILGLVIPTAAQSLFTDPYFPRLIQGITQACNANDQTLSLFLFHTQEEEANAFQQICGRGLIDGLIITSDYTEMDLVSQMRAARFPFVAVGRPDDADDVCYVDVDNVAGARLATRHLLSLGYQRIATITTERNTAGMDRLHGYKQALAEAGHAVDLALIAYGDFSEVSGYAAMQTLLDQRPEAVFAASDQMARGAVTALNEAGLSVPGDVAIVGFDDLSPAVRSEPLLTTVHQPILETGAMAVEMLMQCIRQPHMPPRHVISDVELTIRESCGAKQAG